MTPNDSTSHRAASKTEAVVAPPATPGTWISSLFASPDTNRNDPMREDDSGVALFVGNSNLFKSPPPKVIRLKDSNNGSNVMDVTPLLTRSSPVSAAAESSSSNNMITSDHHDDPHSQQRPLVDMQDLKEQAKMYVDHAKMYMQQGKELLHKTSQSPTCVAAFFAFNVLWTLMRVLSYCFATSASPVHVIAPTSSYMIQSLMDKTCSTNCEITPDSIRQARTDIETQIHRPWKPSELLKMAVQQISAGQAILERVQAEYEALLAEIERDHKLCRFPLAHAWNPQCPPAPFDTEAFVDQMSLF